MFIDERERAKERPRDRDRGRHQWLPPICAPVGDRTRILGSIFLKWNIMCLAVSGVLEMVKTGNSRRGARLRPFFIYSAIIIASQSSVLSHSNLKVM